MSGLAQDRGTVRQGYEITEQVPGTPLDNFSLRIEASADKWNAVNISNPDMGFYQTNTYSVSNYDPYLSCPSAPDFKNGIHYRNVPDNSLAVAKACYVNTIWGYQSRGFQIVYDPDYSWYDGQSSSGAGANQYDVGGIASHEFGHVMGGWSDDDTVHGHYDEVTNASLCGDSVPDSSYHTMCEDALRGAGDTRTLEEHDKDAFQDAY